MARTPHGALVGVLPDRGRAPGHRGRTPCTPRPRRRDLRRTAFAELVVGVEGARQLAPRPMVSLRRPGRIANLAASTLADRGMRRRHESTRSSGARREPTRHRSSWTQVCRQAVNCPSAVDRHPAIAPASRPHAMRISDRVSSTGRPGRGRDGTVRSSSAHRAELRRLRHRRGRV